jgi:hypothetical protein
MQPGQGPQHDPRNNEEIAVFICLGCFDGNILFPLLDTSGAGEATVRDQGIDFFFNSPDRQRHTCDGSMNPLALNMWSAETLRLPDHLLNLILAEGIEHDRWVIDPSRTGPSHIVLKEESDADGE